MRTAYKTLLEQIGLAKIQLDKLASLGRGFAYRDYKKYYDKLHKEKQDYQKFLNILEEKGDDDANK